MENNLLHLACLLKKKKQRKKKQKKENVLEIEVMRNGGYLFI